MPSESILPPDANQVRRVMIEKLYDRKTNLRLSRNIQVPSIVTM